MEQSHQNRVPFFLFLLSCIFSSHLSFYQGIIIQLFLIFRCLFDFLILFLLLFYHFLFFLVFFIFIFFVFIHDFSFIGMLIHLMKNLSLSHHLNQYRHELWFYYGHHLILLILHEKLNLTGDYLAFACVFYLFLLVY